MIHVAYRLWGGEGFYAKMLGTSMLSMFENTKEEVTVHVMHNDRLTKDNYGKLCYIAGQYNQHIEFHNVEEIAGSTLRKFEEAHPIKSGINAAWYPLITHEVFPDLDKIIFLGADTVFNLDVGEMWQYELGEYGFAAVPEICNKVPKEYFKIIVDGYVRHEDYFNVDVMILKPTFFRDNFTTILDGLKFINKKRIESNYSAYLACEQDTLSYLYSKNYLKLPGKFNYIMLWHRMFEPSDSLRLEPAIYHFADPRAKPSLDTDDVFNRLYFEYFLKTPWATPDMFGNMDKELKNIFRTTVNNLKGNLLHFTNLLTQRQRAFFVNKHNIDAMKKIFEIKDDELIINASQIDAGEILLDEMVKSKGTKIFILFVDYYYQIGRFLLSKNFQEGIDFVNATMFLSERHGFKPNFDTKPIVQAM